MHFGTTVLGVSQVSGGGRLLEAGCWPPYYILYHTVAVYEYMLLGIVNKLITSFLVVRKVTTKSKLSRTVEVLDTNTTASRSVLE